MQQTQSYVTWINTQLEKRPTSRHVKDLSHDMRDGVVFLQLVEVISKKYICRLLTKIYVIYNFHLS